MELEQALKYIANIKEQGLKLHLKEIKNQLIGKTKTEVKVNPYLYEASLVVKNATSQIDEIVHATGILKCLPIILEEGEVIEDLSLAASAGGEGIDLITNKRIAEFKFSKWQPKSSNGGRKRQVFADFVNLLIRKDHRKKELYVLGADKIKKYFQSEKASWKKVLSKSGGLEIQLEKFLLDNHLIGVSLNAVFAIESISIIDIDELFSDKGIG